MNWHWVYGTLALLSLVHLAALAYAFRNGGHELRSGGDEERVRGNRVECPDCGATNECRYRYCRACVSELPGALSAENSGITPLGRGML